MRKLKSLFLLFIVVMFSFAMNAQNQGKYFTDKNGVAIKGYDVVAYFTDYKAVEGSEKHSLKYDGVTGYCAFGMAKMNSKVPTDPHTFKIVDGKLYLFFNDLYEGKKFNTIVPWNGDEANLKKAADKNWSAMK